MGIEIRVPRDEDWPALAHADGRAFGHTFTTQELDERRPIIDLDRFRIAVDGPEIVGIVGSFAFDVTMPGGAHLPTAGVTWVSVASTHRRQGLLARLMSALHDDIAEREEPLANLYASEGAIYERFGYGVGSHLRTVEIPAREARIADRFRAPAGAVRFMDDDEARRTIPELWDRFRRLRPGELSHSPRMHEFLFSARSRPDDGASATFHLRHPDGYASYRVTGSWSSGWPDNQLRVTELAALTPDAHAALWQTILEVDLVGKVTTQALPLDDPLPYLLTNYRAVRTTALNDGLWAKVIDVTTCLEARTYATDDAFVIELADGDVAPRRYSVEGSPAGGGCRSVRSKPDLTMTSAALGALIYGGVRPSQLAAGRRLQPRNDDALRRADLFFPMTPLPHTQTFF